MARGAARRRFASSCCLRGGRVPPFYVLASVVATATLFLAYRLRVRQLTHAYNVRLEERWSERTRIARELHDTLLQSFQGLMFRLQAVRDLLPDQAAKSVPVLEMALLNGEKAIDEARNAVSGLRSSERPEQAFDAGLAALAAAAAQLSPGTRGAEMAAGDEGQRQGDSRDGPCTSCTRWHRRRSVTRSGTRGPSDITIEVHYDIDTLWLIVSDDGVGFDEARLASATFPPALGPAGHEGTHREAGRRDGRCAAGREAAPE